MTAVDVIFPCLNEAGALPWLLQRMPAGYRAIVVDNGSTDGSDRIAREYGALVVHESRRGFGSACHTGLEAADADVVAFCDADGSLDPKELPSIARQVIEGDSDLVLGRRKPTGRGAWPIHARAANLVLAHLIRRSCGAKVGDLGPMRAAGRKALLNLDLHDRRFGYPLEMVVKAAHAGWRIAELPVAYHPRTGRSKVTGTVRGTLRTIHDMRNVLTEAGNAR